LTLTVVKVGGSFARFRGLSGLAAALAEGGGRTVVVPGGGPYADLVRGEQKRLGFDDRTAHRMALLAMAEFGYALAALSDGLAPCRRIGGVPGALAEGRTVIWLPLDLLEGDPDVAESWDMTSDSLAAWLAARLGASRLIFMKRAPSMSFGLAELVASNVLDPLTPRFLDASPLPAWLCGPRNISALGRALATGRPVGRPIEPR
jgi:dihydroneopterin aldolase